MKIDEYSTMSVFVQLYYMEGAEKPIGNGTAFTVQEKGQNYLITNWHVVTGRNSVTNKPINENGVCDPDFMLVWFFTKAVGLWFPKRIILKDENGQNLWIEHPKGRQVDVVAIPYVPSAEIYITNLDLSTSSIPLRMYPSREVSIIGYPLGLSAGGKFPIWKKGHVASEMDLDFDNKPIFLIDATTRSGMSGSPVILRQSGLVEMETEITTGTYTKFLGIYSGRIHEQSEIGQVWKPHVIGEIIVNANPQLLPGMKMRMNQP
jgi:Trypsin-like peptidase domain